MDESLANHESNWCVMCYCGTIARKNTVKKIGPTNGKFFYSCSRNMSDPLRCKFFQWHDDINRKMVETKEDHVADDIISKLVSNLDTKLDAILSKLEKMEADSLNNSMKIVELELAVHDFLEIKPKKRPNSYMDNPTPLQPSKKKSFKETYLELV